MVNKTVTHVVTTPNKRPPTQLEQVKLAMGAKDYMKQIENYYRGNKEESMMFLTAAVEYIRKVPKLLECDHQSLLSALVISAQFRFMPSGVSGEGYIIPYGKQANFQLGYQGIITLLWRTGKVKSIKAVIVYKNDKFEYEEGLTTKLVHVPVSFGQEKGDPIGVYAVAETITGGYVFQVMSEKEVMAIKSMSKAKDRAESPWNSKDPEKWMWKKTCLIQLAKLLPKTQEIQRAIEEDYKGEGIDKPVFDAGGPAVGAALHTNEDKIIDQKQDEQPDTDWLENPDTSK
jgi:recombination protein RecT